MSSERSAYARTYARSLEEPEAFWAEAAAEIDWQRPFDKVLDRDAHPSPRWFAGGELNTCHNAVDRHVEAGHGDRIALVYDSAMLGGVRRFSYAELQGEVARFAGALVNLGVASGDLGHALFEFSGHGFPPAVQAADAAPVPSDPTPQHMVAECPRCSAGRISRTPTR